MLAVAVIGCLPRAAEASTASVQDTGDAWRLIVTAAALDGANAISITRADDGVDYVIEDRAGIVPKMPIADFQCSSVDTTHVRCQGELVQAASVTLGDGDDEFTIADSAYPPGPVPFDQPPVRATGDAGQDRLFGGAGADDFRGNDGDDRITGGGGDDFISGDAGEDILDGGAGADSVAGDDGGDTVLGGPGDDDSVRGGRGVDTVDAGDGNDIVLGGEGADTILGGAGDDRLDFARASADTTGRDTLRGGPGNDALNGGPPPTAEGDPQEPDDLGGGDGIDIADFRQRTEPLTIDLDGDADDGESGEGDNVQTDVENVIGGSKGDTLTGSSAANVLDGRDGEDTIEGLGEDDTLLGGVNDPSGDNLSGGSGNDTMKGESGDDALAGGAGDDAEFGDGGGDRVEGETGNDSLAGGTGADTLDGGNGDDSLNGGDVVLIGGEGADVLIGGPGADTLLGGQGNDLLDGGPGPDYIDGQTETDTVTYEDRTSKVFVTLDGQNNDGVVGEHDNVVNVEKILGGILGDDLSGDAAGNTISGQRGEDLIRGDLGADRLLGGAAGDVVMARDGVDDVVDCGGGQDLVIADGQDKDRLIECDTVNRPGPRRLIVGRYALVRPQGQFGLRLPHGRRYFPLAKKVKIPIGSAVDPKAGVVRLATARNRTGARQVASVSAGRFTVRQKRGRRPVTKLRLAGRLPDCRRVSSRRGTAKRAARASARRLRVDVRKKQRRGENRRRGPNIVVLGRFSSGASTGTEWITEETCDGTLTTVLSGTVRVRDFGRGETVTVRPGKPYLASP
jgi:Ca2+-binding RTX toxin-like protein